MFVMAGTLQRAGLGPAWVDLGVMYHRARKALWGACSSPSTLDPSLMPYELRRRAWMHAREEARAAYRAWAECGEGPDRADRVRRLPRRRGARGGGRASVRRLVNPQPRRGLTPGRGLRCGYGPQPVATRIELCGALTVEVDGRRVEEDLPGRQGRLLFAYLALNRERPVRRDELVDVVWDDHPPGSPDAGLAALLTRAAARARPGRRRGPLAAAARAARRVARRRGGAAPRPPTPRRRSPAATRGARPTRAQAALELFERPLLPELAGRWVDEQRAASSTGSHSDALETLARAALRLGGGELPAAERAARALIAARALPRVRLRGC